MSVLVQDFRIGHGGSGGFREILDTGGLEFQDGHSLLESVLGTLSRGEFGHAFIFD